MKISAPDMPADLSGDNRENDERFAWRAASAVMLFFSAATIILRFFGMFPFQDVFAVALVGIPTFMLVMGLLIGFLKRILTGWVRRKPSTA